MSDVTVTHYEGRQSVTISSPRGSTELYISTPGQGWQRWQAKQLAAMLNAEFRAVS